MISPLSFLILLICVLFLYFLNSVTRGLSVFYLLKKLPFNFIGFLYFPVFHFIISTLLLFPFFSSLWFFFFLLYFLKMESKVTDLVSFFFPYIGIYIEIFSSALAAGLVSLVPKYPSSGFSPKHILTAYPVRSSWVIAKSWSSTGLIFCQHRWNQKINEQEKRKHLENNMSRLLNINQLSSS